MLIRELELATGLERPTIRFYEKEGLIVPIRQENGYRVYSEDDKNTLLRIKLLRQLGMSLERIKELQQGSVDFPDALNEQIAAIEKQIRDASRAREVCCLIRDSATSYHDLDAAYYLRELAKPAENVSPWKPQPVPEFKSNIPIHPWKRYFARIIDLTILDLAIAFVLVVILRIRPLNHMIYAFLDFAIVSHLLMIPVEGLLLHYFGTTPGKWFLGIRIESVNGGNLTISQAMSRSWSILIHAYGLTIPIYSLWRMYKSYKHYTDKQITLWDEENGAEIQFSHYYDAKKIVIMTVSVLLIGFMFFWTLMDSVKPVHRGGELTISQVAENYNDVVAQMDEDARPSVGSLLDDEGKWRKVPATPNTGVMIIVRTMPVGEFNDYEYTIEDGYVRKIMHRQEYQDIVMFSPGSGHVSYMIVALATAQDWMNPFVTNDFSNKLTEAMKAEDGTFTYENLQIRWHTEAVNCSWSGSFYYGENGKDSSLTYTVEITLLDN